MWGMSSPGQFKGIQTMSPLRSPGGLRYLSTLPRWWHCSSAKAWIIFSLAKPCRLVLWHQPLISMRSTTPVRAPSSYPSTASTPHCNTLDQWPWATAHQPQTSATTHHTTQWPHHAISFSSMAPFNNVCNSMSAGLFYTAPPVFLCCFVLC